MLGICEIHFERCIPSKKRLRRTCPRVVDNAAEKVRPSGLMAAVRKKRIALGMAQGALATIVGCSQVEVSMWELGRQIPGRIAVAKLSAWLEKVG